MNRDVYLSVYAEFKKGKVSKSMDRGARNIYSGIRNQMRTLEYGQRD